MQVIRGFVAPFRGVLFVSRHGLWGLFAAPFLLNFVLGIGAGGLAWHFAFRWLAGPGGPLPDWAGNVVAFLVSAIVALLAFVVLQPILAAPFIDLLCERCERILRGDAPSAGILRSAQMAIAQGVLKAALYATAFVFTLAIGALTGAGSLLGAALYGLFIAYDAFDYPLSRRAVSFRGKWRYLLSRPGQTLGYCCGAGVLYLVPLAALVASPFAAVGATLLYLESEPDGPA